MMKLKKIMQNAVSIIRKLCATYYILSLGIYFWIRSRLHLTFLASIDKVGNNYKSNFEILNNILDYDLRTFILLYLK